MPYIQVNKRGKVGGKRSDKFSITLPKEIVKFMEWKHGDEPEFKLEKGKIILRGKE